MTSIDQMERREADIENASHHWARLLDKLGDGREWEYQGEVNDCGKPISKCACGHAIRWEYVIHRERDGAVAVVGSECINSFQDANPDLWAALTAAAEKVKADLAEAKRQAKAARDNEDVMTLQAAWQDQVARAERFIAQAAEWDRYLPETLYHLKCRTIYLRGPKQFKRTCDYKRWYAEAERQITKVLEGLTSVDTWERRRRW